MQPDDSPWPRVSIVTPSHNQGQFIEETIRSVLLQGYPNLEYIILDGGSTDDSVDIIRKYELWLAYWVSEPDRGQSHAINKGFERSTGDVFNWLNSDDIYFPGVIAPMARAHQTAPDEMIAGPVLNVLETVRGPQPARLLSPANICLEDCVRFWDERCVRHQPGIFFPTRVWREAGGLDETLHYAMDLDLLCRAVQHTSVTYIPDVIARFRVHESSKTSSRRQHLAMFRELIRVSARYQHLIPGFDSRSYHAYATDHLVRWAGTEALAGQYGNALEYLKTSLEVNAAETLKRLVLQFLTGVGRRISATRPVPPKGTMTTTGPNSSAPKSKG